MRDTVCAGGPEKAFLKDLKEPARGEIGAENGDEASKGQGATSFQDPKKRRNVQIRDGGGAENEMSSEVDSGPDDNQVRLCNIFGQTSIRHSSLNTGSVQFTF